MRGKRRGKLGLLLLPAALLGAGVAGAETAPPASQSLPTAIVVLDASKTMGDKIGGATKLSVVRAALGEESELQAIRNIRRTIAAETKRGFQIRWRTAAARIPKLGVRLTGVTKTTARH